MWDLARLGALASPNRSAARTVVPRFDCDSMTSLAAYQLQAFLHAGQAESHASTRRIDIEANAIITNGEMDGVPGSAKMHSEMLRPAVSHPVVQGLPGGLGRDRAKCQAYTARNVLVPGNQSRRFLPGELPTETAHRGRNARCSSRGGCSWCDSACTSAAISAVCF
jgi:hypothetical protein